MACADRRQAGLRALAALVVASALLHALAFPPWNVAAAAWVTLAPLFFALERVAPRTAFALGVLWGVVAHWAEAYWILPAMSFYYQQPWWFAVAFGVGSSLLFRGLHYGLFAAAVCWLSRGRQGAGRVVVFALTWTAFELLRARGPTADPWLLLGYAAVQVPVLLQVADIGGIYLVSFGMALVNAALAEVAPVAIAAPAGGSRAGAVSLLATRIVPAVLLVAGFWGAAYAYGAWHLAAPVSAPAGVPITVVQGNNDLGAQWHPERDLDTLETYLALSRAAVARAHPRLLVWPESAVTFFLAREPRFLERIRGMLAATGTALLAGAPHFEDADPAVPSYFNSAFYITGDGIQARYDKVRLLPFAEYFPLRFADFLRRRFGRVRSFTPGQGPQLIETGIGRLAIVICFEAVFAELVRERMHGGADLLVNLSNDAWLGASSGPAQHLVMVVPRAVENRTWVVRATTSGISAVIDPYGVAHDPTPTFVQAVVDAQVSPAHRSTMYQEWGDWFAGGCALAAAGLGMWKLRSGGWG
jgi:apolipoprotein N-acyltransferase